MGKKIKSVDMQSVKDLYFYFLIPKANMPDVTVRFNEDWRYPRWDIYRGNKRWFSIDLTHNIHYEM